MSDKRTKVLLVEDNPADARLVREMLAGPGAGPFDVTVADRLSRAIEMLAAGKFDVALVDLGLPDSAGVATVDRMRTAAQGLALIVSTGLDDEEVALVALRGGAQDYVVKGRIESDGLTRAIKYAIERKRAEEEQRRLQGDMQAILDNLPGIAFFKDRQSRYVLVNRHFTTYKNCVPSDVVGKTDEDIYPAEQARKIAGEDRRIFETGGPLTIEHLSAFSDRVFRIVKVPLKDPAGAVTGIVGMSFELTDHVKVEKEMQSTKAFLDNVINAIADPVFVKDDRRCFVLVNDALCAMVGRPREGLIGEDGDDMFPREQVEVFREMDSRVLETGVENINEESLSNLSSGEVRTIVTRKTRHVDSAGKQYLVGVIRDFTERKQAEERIKSQLDELRRWQNVMLGREDRVLELKREVNELCRRLGEPVRYPGQDGGGGEAPK